MTGWNGAVLWKSVWTMLFLSVAIGLPVELWLYKEKIWIRRRLTNEYYLILYKNYDIIFI
jgi:hypothetical protein